MTAETKPRRRWPYIAAALLLVVALLGALSWRYRTIVAEEAAGFAVQAFGLGDDIEFRVAEIEHDRLRLEDLRYGADGPSAAAAEIRFRPGEIARGRIESIELFEPTIRLVEGPDGGILVEGLPAADGSADKREDTADAGDTRFPALPGIRRIEIQNGLVELRLPGLSGAGAIDLTAEREDDGRLKADIDASIATEAGQEATFAAKDVELAYAPDGVRGRGVANMWLGDGPNDADAAVAAWLDIAATPEGVLDGEAILMSASGQIGKDARFEDARGRIRFNLPETGAPRAEADLNVVGVRSDLANFDLGAVVADLTYGAFSLLVDGTGSSGHVSLAADRSASNDRIALSAKGELEARTVAALIPDVEASGIVRFDANALAPENALAGAPALADFAGAAELEIDAPRLFIGDLAPEGGARGEVRLSLSGGAVTLTSPGLAVAGVRLPASATQSLPPEFQRAFQDPALLRLGGEGLANTVLTTSRRPEGGVTVVGKLGLGLSNPNLAVFFEGDGAVGIDAAGDIAFVESDRMRVRLVDADLGQARVGGQAELIGLSGDAERIEAEAVLSLGASAKLSGFEARRAEVDLKGPLAITPELATLQPEPGGRIRLVGYRGPLARALDPIRLTLTRRGDRVIAYDRQTDELSAKLQFRGFKARAEMSMDSEAGPTPFDAALDGFGIDHGPGGTVLRMQNAAFRIPAYEVAFSGIDGRIAFGTERSQTGRLRIGAIRHLGETPWMRPLSMQIDVRGKGDLLTFDGAVIAAGDRARLSMRGRHYIQSGRGDARFSLGPVVFAPGVLQPQDFAPPLYRTLLETIGQAKVAAEIGWSPEGIARETATLNLSIDKLSTSEIVIERLETDFTLDSLLTPGTPGPQRIRIGRLDVGLPLARGAMDVHIVSPERIEIEIEQFELFGGVIKGQRLVIDPTREEFDATLQVSDIDLESILAFAEFGELQATGKLEGRIPLSYRAGELRVHDGVLKTVAGGGRLKYRPREFDKALEDVDRSTSLALKALANFAYDEISIRINEIDAEELRLEIFISGKSLDVFGGLPVQFNIVIEGPLRQIIRENLTPPELPPEIRELIDQSKQTSALQSDQ